MVSFWKRLYFWYFLEHLSLLAVELFLRQVRLSSFPLFSVHRYILDMMFPSLNLLYYFEPFSSIWGIGLWEYLGESLRLYTTVQPQKVLSQDHFRSLALWQKPQTTSCSRYRYEIRIEFVAAHVDIERKRGKVLRRNRKRAERGFEKTRVRKGKAVNFY